MKGSFLVLALLAAALLAAALAPVLISDPGLVQLRFGSWIVETSVLVLVCGVLGLWLLLYLAVRIWRMPAEAARRMREQRALRQLERGLLALTEGDWAGAERALQKSAGATGGGTARYLAAAQAADGQEAPERTEWYLEQADAGGRRTHFLVELTRARLMTENGRYAEALPILEDLQRSRRRNTQVLELLSRCYRELGRWREQQELIPAMRKVGLVDEARAEELASEAVAAQLKASRTLEDLEAAFKSLSRAMQKSAPAARAFAGRARELGHPDGAEVVLRTALQHEWDSTLVLAYGDPSASDVSRRMKQCEKWLSTHPEDPRLHLALGRLCAREELWGKARHHMVRSLEIEPTTGGYDSLGQLLERKGELEQAMACFRNALRMSQGEKPLPLPQGPGQPRALTVE